MAKVNPNETVIEYKSKEKNKSTSNTKSQQSNSERVKYKKNKDTNEPSLLDLMLQESGSATAFSTSLRDDAIKSDFSLKFVKGKTEESEVDNSLLELSTAGDSGFSNKILELD